MVKQTGLHLLCLSVKGGVPGMCMGAVKRVVFPRHFVNRAIVLSVHIGGVSCGRTDLVGLLIPQ